MNEAALPCICLLNSYGSTDIFVSGGRGAREDRGSRDSIGMNRTKHKMTPITLFPFCDQSASRLSANRNQRGDSPVFGKGLPCMPAKYDSSVDSLKEQRPISADHSSASFNLDQQSVRHILAVWPNHCSGQRESSEAALSCAFSLHVSKTNIAFREARPCRKKKVNQHISPCMRTRYPVQVTFWAPCGIIPKLRGEGGG